VTRKIERLIREKILHNLLYDRLTYLISYNPLYTLILKTIFEKQLLDFFQV
jgi:hypothetical protein